MRESEGESVCERERERQKEGARRRESARKRLNQINREVTSRYQVEGAGFQPEGDAEALRFVEAPLVQRLLRHARLEPC